MVEQHPSQQHPLLGTLRRLARERYQRTIMRSFLRSLWLALCVWCIGLGGYLAELWPLRLDIIGLVSGLVVVIGLGSLLRRPMRPRDVARRLDARFELNEQLTTAIELLNRPAISDMVGAHLLDRSVDDVRSIRREVHQRQAAPLSEAIAVIALSLVLAGLLLMTNIGGIADLITSGGPLPELTQPQQPPPDAEQPQQPPPQGQQPGAAGQPPGGAGQQGQQGDQQTLGPIADALRGQGATRPAADALDRGDVAGAAESLRDLADRADELSDESRRDLAENLNAAADQIEQQNPDLAEQLRQSANALQQGGQNAERGMEELADAIEQSQAAQEPGEQAGQQGDQNEPGGEQNGEQPGQQGEGQQPSQQGQGGGTNPSGGEASGQTQQDDRSERLGVEGQPIELDAQGDGQTGQNENKPPTSSGGTVPGFTQGGSTSSERVQTGSDPLRVPADERDVVQDYFSP